MTLLTTEAIYQSADFQLTDGDTGDPLFTESMKLVTVHYPSWEGFITYTGVGRWRNRDTAEWVVDWLTGMSDAQPAAIIDRLCEKGTAFLRTIERVSGGRRYLHTFVFAAFVDGRPRVTTVSNFEECSGRSQETPSSELSTDSREMRQRPLLLVTGRKPAVRRSSRRQLERMAGRSDTSPARIRVALTQMNAEASGAAEAGGTISEGCSVASFRRDGSGFQDLTLGSDAHSRSLMNGQPMPDIAALVGRNPGHLVGLSFGRSANSEQQPHRSCVPRIVTPDSAGQYQLTELTHGEFDSAVARDVNELATVVGSGTPPGQPGAHLLCIWDPDQSGELLTIKGTTGVRGLNNSGDIGVTAEMSNGSVHATRWSPDTLADDLGTVHGTTSDAFADSGATAINNQGVVVGWVSLSLNPQDRGQGNHRPAAWAPTSEPAFLTDVDFGFAWGQAVDINDAGTVLVVAYTEGIIGRCKALLWDPVSGTVSFVGGNEPDGIYPNSLTEDGSVLGTRPTATGETVAYVSRPGTPWSRLGTPDGWYATAMNDAGDVAGSLPIQGFSRAWMRRASGEVIWLPYFEHHHCQPSSVTNNGLLVGVAHTDHGTHALLWSRAIVDPVCNTGPAQGVKADVHVVIS